MPKPEFKTEWESAAYDRAFEAMKNLLDVANSMGSGRSVVAGMLDGFLSEHRTLQQSFVRNLALMLKQWSEMDKSMMTDLRNQDAFAFAQEVVKLDPMFASI